MEYINGQIDLDFIKKQVREILDRDKSVTKVSVMRTSLLPKSAKKVKEFKYAIDRGHQYLITALRGDKEPKYIFMKNYGSEDPGVTELLGSEDQVVITR